MISIAIPVVHEKYFKEVLESINSQTYDKYEVIVVNDKGSDRISKIISNYGAYEIVESGSLLRSRYLASIKSKGSTVFFLDETRPLIVDDALEMISQNNSDIIFSRETEIIINLVSRIASIEREYIYSSDNIKNFKPYIVPRIYNRSLVLKALNRVKNKLGNVYQWATIMPEDLFIYYEARKFSNSFSEVAKPIIKHYGDFTIGDIVRKNYRYGRGFGVTSFTPYRDIGSLLGMERMTGRIKSSKSLSDSFLSLMFLGVKGFSAFIGEESEKLRIRQRLKAGENLF